MPLFAANKSEANGTDQPFAAADDEEAPPAPPQAPVIKLHMPKKKKDKHAKSDQSSLFPNPKQVVTIFSPIVHTITQDVDPVSNQVLESPHSSYVDGVWKGFVVSALPKVAAAANTANAANTNANANTVTTVKRTKKRHLKIKMGTLIVKMLNRLVRERVVAYDRVFLSRTATHLLVRILASERTVPILLMRCERIGVGSVVGAAFGTELEWSMVPRVTEEMQEEAIERAAMENAGGAAGTSGGGTDAAGAGTGVGAGQVGPFSLDRINFVGGGGGSAGGGGAVQKDGNIGGGTTDEGTEYEQGFKVTLDAEVDKAAADEDEVVSISSEDDDDEEEDGNAGGGASKDTNKTPASDTDAADGTNAKAETAGVELGIPTIMSSERKAKLGVYIAEARKEWLETGSRLRVLQVMESVEAGASFTFDYAAYVILAAWVAAMGLVNNSVAVVVASMLLSPLMGPCLGATLGFTLKKPSLVKLGLVNECISLVICILVGMFIGVIVVSIETPAVKNWPSGEMTSRGSATGLVSGMLIAIPSGMGVALSVLGRNSGGLTGVAISLSLLPPAVNAGICWMAAALYSTGAATRNDGDTTDYAFVGSFSLLLTLVNIVCIFLGGTFMFKVKEVAPIKNKNTFWSRDVKIARNHRKTIKPNAKAIKLGVKAALELEEALAREGNLHTDANTHGHRHRRHEDQMRVAEARRRGLAANVVDDALFVGGGNIIADEDIVAGGAVDDDMLPSESVLRDYVDDLTMDTDKESLLDCAGKIGGLDEAGELLFSNFADMATADATTNEWDDRFGDYGMSHGAIAGAVLLS